MRHHQKVKGSVVFFSLCSSIFLLCEHVSMNKPILFSITYKVCFQNAACEKLLKLDNIIVSKMHHLVTRTGKI